MNITCCITYDTQICHIHFLPFSFQLQDDIIDVSIPKHRLSLQNSIQSIIRKTPWGFCGFLATQRVLLQYFLFSLLLHPDTRLTQSRSNKLHRHAVEFRYFGSGDCRASSNVAPADDPRGGEIRGEGSLTLIKKSNHRDEAAPALEWLA